PELTLHSIGQPRGGAAAVTDAWDNEQVGVCRYKGLPSSVHERDSGLDVDVVHVRRARPVATASARAGDDVGSAGASKARIRVDDAHAPEPDERRDGKSTSAEIDEEPITELSSAEQRMIRDVDVGSAQVGHPVEANVDMLEREPELRASPRSERGGPATNR